MRRARTCVAFPHPVVFRCGNEAHAVHPPSADGHLDCLQFLAIMSETATNRFAQVFYGFTGSCLSGKFPRSRVHG